MTRYEINCIKDKLYDMAQTIEFPGSETKLRYVDVKDIDAISNVMMSDNKAALTKIRDDLTMDDLSTILSDGFAESNAFCDVDFDNNEYYRAKEELLKEGWSQANICLEDVEAKMLMMGYSLQLLESEEPTTHQLTLEKLLKGLDMAVDEYVNDAKCSRLHAICCLLDDGDFYVYEGIIQRAIFGEVVYG